MLKYFKRYITINTGNKVNIEDIELSRTGTEAIRNCCLKCILYNNTMIWFDKVAPYCCFYKSRIKLKKEIGECSVDYVYKLKK